MSTDPFLPSHPPFYCTCANGVSRKGSGDETSASPSKEGVGTKIRMLHARVYTSTQNEPCLGKRIVVFFGLLNACVAFAVCVDAWRDLLNAWISTFHLQDGR